jgi:large subunit ribosomal protein L13
MKTVDKTFVPKGKLDNHWVLVDADGKNLGRLAGQVAHFLLGKHKPTYTPGVEAGDYVVVINATKIQVAPRRYEEKMYYHHSNYPGGLKTTSLRDQLKNHPDRVILHAVWGMLPHNKWGRHLLQKLKVYGGAEHPHEAQNPQPVA